MSIPFRVRIKWIRFKSWLLNVLSIERERPFIDRSRGGLVGLLFIAAFVLSACGVVQVGVESTETQNVDPAPIATPTSSPEPTLAEQTIPSVVSDGPGPDVFWMPYGAGLYESDDVIMVEEGVVGFSESPVTFEIFYDYSPASGRVAYGSEFWHAAEGSNVSVSDLWVYDYASRQDRELLVDNVGRAVFSPVLSSGEDSEKLAVAVYNTETDRFDLALVDEQGNLDVLASCASHSFSWSPDGSMIAYEARDYTESSSPPEECTGVFVISIEDRSVTKISEQPPSVGGWQGDQPIWAEGQDALLLTYASPESVFAVTPLDGSGAYLVEKSDSISIEYLPNPTLSLWSEPYNSVVGQTEGMGPMGVWVYQFSEDMRTIEDAYRIEIDGRVLDLQLIGWWVYGESVLLRDLTNLSELNQFGRAIVWSLRSEDWEQVADNVAEIEVKVHADTVRTGVPAVDEVIEAFLAGEQTDRLEKLEMISAACVNQDFGVGPPQCPEGTPEGTELVVFPYRLYRATEFAAENDLEQILAFDIKGLYAVQPIEGGFEESWWPAGSYKIIFVSTDANHAIEVIVDQDGGVVKIEFRELTPVETLYGYSGEYLLPPLS